MLPLLSLAHAAETTTTPVTQADRVEIVADKRDDWNVVPLGRDGLLLTGSDAKADGFTFSRYSTELHPLWTTDWVPPTDMNIEDVAVEGGAAWFLMHKTRKKDFTVLEVSLADGATQAIPLLSPVKTLLLDGLLVHGTEAYLLAMTSTRDFFRGTTGVLLHVDLPTRTTDMVAVPAAGKNELRLDHLVSGPGPDDIALTGAVERKHHRTMYVLDLEHGAVKHTLEVAPALNEEKNLLTATRVRTTGDDSLVVGTFASGEKDYAAQGMYVAGYNGNTQAWTRYHSFTSFKHFFDYLPDKLRARVERKIEKRADKGLDLDLNYMLDLHAPMVLGDRYVMVAEAYYPEYHTYSQTYTTTVNGVTTTQTRTYQVFDGYRYTHAVVAAFDKQGQLLWDSSVPIGNVLSPTVREQVAVQVLGDHIKMMYCVAGKVYALEADGNEVHGEKAEQRLVAEDEDEQVKTSWNSHSAWWYDDWFLVWGFERIKGDDGKRTVFAFTKAR
jgi:hypothetical protein